MEIHNNVDANQIKDIHIPQNFDCKIKNGFQGNSAETFKQKYDKLHAAC